MSMVESRIVGNADYEKAVTKILTSGTKYQNGVRNMAVYWKCRHQLRVSRYRK
jgi:hypothetical protein